MARRHVPPTPEMLGEALQCFKNVLQICKNMDESEIFNPIVGGCTICMANITNRLHPNTQNHRKRIICVKLLKLLDEIQMNPNEIKLATKLSEIHLLLTTRESTTYLLNTDRSHWPEIYNAGQHGSRADGKPDGGKIWFKCYLDDLGFKIKSVTEANDDHSLSELVTNLETIISELTQGKKRKSSQGCKQVRICRNDVRPHTIFHFPFARQY